MDVQNNDIMSEVLFSHDTVAGHGDRATDVKPIIQIESKNILEASW